jgi:hypothetical protein
MESEMFNEIMERLKSENLIRYFDLDSSRSDISASQLLSLLDEIKNIEIRDGELCYIDDDGQLFNCPHVETAVTDCGWWLSDKIPAPNFDIEQSGNLRKAQEAECAYICTIVASILNDKMFNEELEDVIKAFDFNTMTGGNTFSDLLNDWLNLQSVIINIIVSAAKYSISSQKKDSESFLLDGLSIEEVAGLRDLGLSIKAINFEYSTGALSPDKVKLLTKIDRLRIISERDFKIDSLIIKSKFGTLFKLTKLSSEYVSPIIKKRVF